MTDCRAYIVGIRTSYFLFGQITGSDPLGWKQLRGLLFLKSKNGLLDLKIKAKIKNFAKRIIRAILIVNFLAPIVIIRYGKIVVLKTIFTEFNGKL